MASLSLMHLSAAVVEYHKDLVCDFGKVGRKLTSAIIEVLEVNIRNTLFQGQFPRLGLVYSSHLLWESIWDHIWAL